MKNVYKSTFLQETNTYTQVKAIRKPFQDCKIHKFSALAVLAKKRN